MTKGKILVVDDDKIYVNFLGSISKKRVMI